MAWIHSYDDIWEHYKTKRLAKSLGIGLPETVGHLHSLWHFILRNAWRDADMAQWGDAGIEEAARWSGKRGLFVKAVRNAGFLDGTIAHGWTERAGDLVYDRLYAEKRRKKSEIVGNDRPLEGEGEGEKEKRLSRSYRPAKQVQSGVLKPRTAIQRVMRAYKVAKGIDPDDAAWDKANFAGHSRAAKKLLGAIIDVKAAMTFLVVLGQQWDESGIKDWTLAAIARHAWDKRGQIDEAKSENGTDESGRGVLQNMGNRFDSGKVGPNCVLETKGPARITCAGEISGEIIEKIKYRSNDG